MAQSYRLQIEQALFTAKELLMVKDSLLAYDVLRTAEFQIVETGYDNWNGGTDIFTVFLQVDIPLFVRIEEQNSDIADSIEKALATSIRGDQRFLANVAINPAPPNVQKRRNYSGEISATARRNALDEIRVRAGCWSGQLDDVSFLKPIFDLKSMPSIDPRHLNAEQDITRHRLANCDWPDDWIFTDERFSLHKLPKEKFFEFVCAVVHPLTKRENAEQSALVSAINGHLALDGWELIETTFINEQYIYEPRQKLRRLSAPTQKMKAAVGLLKSEDLFQNVDRLGQIGDTNPAEAIGLAKEVVEACCRLILDDRGVKYDENGRFPNLIKALLKEIELMPGGIREDAKGAKEIKAMLAGFGSIVSGLATVRNEYGRGHGKGRKFQNLKPRYARLAVGAATTFVEFVVDRHFEKL